MAGENAEASLDWVEAGRGWEAGDQGWGGCTAIGLVIVGMGSYHG